MNWIERIENIELEIITGNGKSYFPLWKVANKKVSYNNKAFDFVGKKGTYIERKEPKGKQYEFIFYFQGAENLDVAKDFLLSAENKKSWTIRHPLYDDLIVQPLNLEQNNDNQNISIISGTFWETINIDEIIAKPNSTAIIDSKIYDIDNSVVEKFNDYSLQSNTATIANDSVLNINKAFEGITFSNDDKAEYIEIKNAVNAYSLSIANEMQKYSEELIKLVNFPNETDAIIQRKTVNIISAYNNILELCSVANQQENTFFQLIGSALIGSICKSAISQSYNSREDVVVAIENIELVNDYWRDYFDTYSEILQDEAIASNVDLIINETIGNLFAIAFNSKQLRQINLDADSNIIILAYKYFGSGDENLQKFIDLNNLKVSEFLQLKKGRQINYYV